MDELHCSDDSKKLNIYLRGGPEARVDLGYVAYRGFQALDGAPGKDAKFPFFTLSSIDVDVPGFRAVQCGVMIYFGPEPDNYMHFPVDCSQPPRNLATFVGEAAAMLNTRRSGIDHEGPIPIFVLDEKWRPAAGLLSAYVEALRERLKDAEKK